MLYPHHIRKLLADRRGATAILIGVMAAMLIGFTSLGAEITMLLMTQREMQSAADSAAISAANAQQLGIPSPYTQEGFALAADRGFSAGQRTTCPNPVTQDPTVYVGIPCSDSTYVGQSAYVEALILQPHALNLANVVNVLTYHLRGKAVAKAPFDSGSCTLSLATTGTGVKFAGNNASVNYNNCAVAANSTSSNAINVQNGCLNAAQLFAQSPSIAPNGALHVGNGVVVNCASSANPDCTSNPNCILASAGLLNPYASLTAPTGLPPGNLNNSTGVATPGSFPSFNPKNNATTLMCPGVYVITGSISIAGSTIVKSVPGTTAGCPNSALAEGVTIFLTGSITVNGSASMTLNPQTTGQYAGIVMYSPTGSISNGGNATTNLTGAVIFPQGDVKYNGNGVDNGHSCTRIISNTITFTGNSTLGSDCASLGTKPILHPATLVE